ncbi:transketolase [Roseivirga spongicola]|uniref:3-methyl-2-oxobutanoate dehydrogenase (2-methylpropanoyl-transferring) n=1 Tax=Roseivirga spongicola TaxID=333140 RepID=A0A150XBD6_9BACT|nr:MULTISPECIES: alpha-ketoacid dehydrogenase subunit alpha/beta [Roseivirga]KYG76033.1 transketolase [Roseivirga spongicola]MBO6659215.1 transketolase [Roseivirga sp.]MBO6908048.1 transketolase [Roseivirga sp.]
MLVGESKTVSKKKINAQEVLEDYKLAVESREASIIGRKEVFMGKAKFGIFGDGKELPQIAMAKVFRNGDFRSGYYRDQTFMFAIGELTVQQYFAQLYAHTSVEADPASGGRLMNGHFANRLLDEQGNWKSQTSMKNSSSDISPTAAQMPRLVGLAYASKLYKQNQDLHQFTDFSIKGNEVAFGTIGNASTSEGHFFESINAAGVLQVPMVMAVWDDEYGISVPQEYHTTKGSISEFLAGIQRDKDNKGYEIIKAKGWDYEGLKAAFQKAEKVAREEHVPVLVHVQEVTQPQGHSTSGSHERYKTKERLEWEKAHDCLVKFKEWILENNVASEEELKQLEKEAKDAAKSARVAAWNAFLQDIKKDQEKAVEIIEALAQESEHGGQIIQIVSELKKTLNPIRLDTYKAVKKVLRLTRNENTSSRASLVAWLKKSDEENYRRFSSHVMSESEEASLKVEEVKASFSESSPLVDGREVLQACFDAALSRDPRVIAFGEDVGKIGDVNQAFAGLQAKYGELRVTDTGIREATIIGQGIGAALRGLRPIAEIQYLDYLLYAIQTLSDDLATLQYRTVGGQKAPLIIRTRGHRLEGVWHSGSPIGMILNSLRGINVLVPRNMTQAAGFYNTMLKSDDPALIIECLNGYRLKERIPDNIGEFTVPVGVPEVIKEGSDVTVITYGSMCRVVEQAAEELQEVGISVEIIDVQSLLPFDVHHSIVESLKKTNRVVFADEDVPGGASAYMMQKVLEEQNGYFHLDSQPVTITAAEHRPAYASDGDYWSKPSVETVFEKVYDLMGEVEPDRFPKLY